MIYSASTRNHANYIVSPNLSCIISLCSSQLLLREFQFCYWFWALKKIKITPWQRACIAYFGFFVFYFPFFFFFFTPFLSPSLPLFLLQIKSWRISLLRRLNSLNRESSLIQTPRSYLHSGFIFSFVTVLAIRKAEEASPPVTPA